MKIPINKGYFKNYPVYDSNNKKISFNEIKFTNKHYIITHKNGNQEFYDINGKDNNGNKIYCKIPFNLSKTCLNIVYWISIILSTIVILYPTFKLNINSIIPFIIMMIFGPFINIIFEEWQEMKLEKFVHISKNKST